MVSLRISSISRNRGSFNVRFKVTVITRVRVGNGLVLRLGLGLALLFGLM